MNQWEWESFEGFLNDRSFAITEAGPLRTPIRSYSISRDEKLQIILETTAAQNARSPVPDHPPGTVRMNNDAVNFAGMLGTVVAHGVQSRHQSAKLSDNPVEEESKEVATVSSLDATISHADKPVAYVIEWLANVDDSFVWPHFSEDKVVKSKTRRLHDLVNGVDMRAGSDLGGSSRNCVRFVVDEIVLYLVAYKSLDGVKVKRPGFVLYEGEPSKEFRKKIVDCLSFTLGCYLVRLGSSAFDDDWNLLSVNAISAYALGGGAFNHAIPSPAPLGFKFQREIDPAPLQRMMSALYTHYDGLRLGSLCWAYWHAVVATPHIAAVHFGAAIEALQAAYLKINKGAIETALLKKDVWCSLSPKLLSAIGETPVDDSIRQVLINKVGDFNKPPHSVITDRLLEVLNLQLGEREKSAWKRRNDAGHGNELDPDGYIELIRDIKLLRIRFNRILLAITGASDSYNDDFTINHAVRMLGEAVA